MELSPTLKKILAAIGLVLTVGVMGWAIWFVFFRTIPVAVDPNGNATSNTNGQLPSSGAGGNQQLVNINGQLVPATSIPTSSRAQIPGYRPQEGDSITTVATQLTKSPVAFAGASGVGQVRYYDQATDRFYSIDAAGHIRNLGDQQFFNVQNATWAKSSNKVILEYPDGTNTFNDLDTNKQVTLPQHWQQFSFAPDASQIAFVSSPTNESDTILAIASPNGQDIRAIETIGTANITVDWAPHKQFVGLEVDGVNHDRQNLFFIGLNQENFRLTQVEGRDFRYQWSPSGNQMLYSVYGDETQGRPTLWAVGSNPSGIGTDRRRLNVNTWADKCTFTTENIVYCAVPDSLPELSGVVTGLHTGPETIVKIDLATGAKTTIAAPENVTQIDQIVVRDNGRSLFVVESGTNQLYVINQTP